MKLKNLNRAIIAITMMLIGIMPAMAYDFEVDGIYYNIISLEEMTVEVTFRDAGYDCYSNDIIIPSSVNYSGNTYKVTRIGIDAFINCSGLTNITMPESITTICRYAFSGCSGLTNITMPEGVTSIGNNVFNGCYKLNEVEWNAKKCENFGHSPYDNIVKNQITTFVFGNKVEHIPAFLCSGLSNLTDVIIPESVTSIGYYAFEDCNGLTSIIIPESVTSIGPRAFPYSLTNVKWNAVKCNDFPDGDTSPFYSQITSFVFGNKVKHIPGYLFARMSNITNITIPNSVTSIGNGAFSGCTALVNVSLSENIKSIEYSTFDGCLKLANITIPKSVTSIGNYAFFGCSGLTNITIPENVKTIGTNAFEGCNNLVKIESWAVIPPIVENEEQFSDEVYQRCILYVPTGSKEDYKFSYAWSEFYNIEEKDFSNGVSITNIGDKNNLCISSADGRILISGANDEDVVQVYTIGGILMTESNVLNIQNAVFNTGIYIVVINGKIHKLVL